MMYAVLSTNTFLVSVSKQGNNHEAVDSEIQMQHAGILWAGASRVSRPPNAGFDLHGLWLSFECLIEFFIELCDFQFLYCVLSFLVAGINIDYSKNVFAGIIGKSAIDHNISLNTLKWMISIHITTLCRLLDFFVKFIRLMLFKEFFERRCKKLESLLCWHCSRVSSRTRSQSSGCSKFLLVSLRSTLLILVFSNFIHWN